RLEFGEIPVVKFVASNLDGVEDANHGLLKSLRSFADQIYRNQSAGDSDTLVSELSQFFNFWLKLRGLLPQYFAEVVTEGQSLDALFDALRSVLEEALSAMEDKDFVLAADLIQYEVVPAVEKVHGAIPKLQAALRAAG
ncbi:MAG: hypothetical protein KDK78_11155, partial [Chlamydiia bacterium]|nr:hypothetical protein [Chlamydiia bacterium]